MNREMSWLLSLTVFILILSFWENERWLTATLVAWATLIILNVARGKNNGG